MQGRWAFVWIMFSALLLGCIVNLSPIILWPIGTLVLGLACGLSAFLPDQNGGGQFLAAQRIPLGRVWAVKTFGWGTVLAVALAVVWYVATGLIWFVAMAFQISEGADQNVDHFGQFGYWIREWMTSHYTGEPINPAVLLGYCSICGFCCGHFFGLLARRTIIAGFLATVFATAIVALWAPSILLGGVAIGWVLIIPLLLLSASRFLVRPWASERLLTRRPVIGVSVLGVLTATTILGFVWQRATEVPDVGEPFDVKAFTESLPPIEKNEAGSAIRHALADLTEHRQKVDALWGTPSVSTNQSPYSNWTRDVVQTGWPSADKELSRWLDQIFQGKWVGETQRAVRLPLGMVQDPRLVSSNRSLGQTGQQCDEMARLFMVRALQVQVQGDSRSALNHLETALALSRQVKNNAPLYLFYYGDGIETYALLTYRLWLQTVGPDKQLLLEAQEMLERHQTLTPEITNSIKAQFLVNRDNFGQSPQSKTRIDELVALASLTPWENERQRRIFLAITLGQLRLSQEPLWKNAYRLHGRLEDRVGLPLKDGPGSEFTPEQWEEFVREFSMVDRNIVYPSFLSTARSRRFLSAVLITTAMALYQTDRAKPPETLDDLVPTYLASVPIDPILGMRFGFLISKGERIAQAGGTAIELAPGQAVIFAGGGISDFRLLAPSWVK